MTRLERLLARVPAVWSELGRSLKPGSGSVGGERVSGNPRVEAPDVANLTVVEHRHRLVRGLRWWVDAVTPDPGDRPMGLGDSPARMCAWLWANVAVMAAEDAAELERNLWEWESEALPLIGAVATPDAPVLPREALEQVVPVHVAASALGVGVSTVKRRTVGRREGGRVLLRDAAGVLCVLSDLPPAWCAHCRNGVRSVTAELA